MTAEQMPRCRDCRWWGAFGDEDPGLGICRMFTVVTPYIGHTLYQLFKRPGHGDNLVTGELFGCVQFEPKESPS